MGKKHGLCVRDDNNRQPRLYTIWIGMKQRCHNEKNPAYPEYGGRGITVCEEWRNNFPAFYAWAMSSGYRDDLSIDRIDNDKGYSPDNCRWETRITQSYNRRPFKRPGRCKKIVCVETGVVYENLNEIRDKLGISPACISECVHGRQKTAGGFHWKRYEPNNESVG